MTGRLKRSAQRVQQALLERGLSLNVVELPRSTRTAAEAAAAIGCTVGQIAKSVVFRTAETDRPVIVIASGANQVDLERLSSRVGEPLGLADPEFVRSRTGYAIGGVPPVGHSEQVQTFIDKDLFQFGEIWAAAGTPHAVFRLKPADLMDITSGAVVDI